MRKLVKLFIIRDGSEGMVGDGEAEECDECDELHGRNDVMLMTFQLFKFCFMSLITDGKSHNTMAKASTRVPIERGCSDTLDACSF